MSFSSGYANDIQLSAWRILDITSSIWHYKYDRYKTRYVVDSYVKQYQTILKHWNIHT